MFVAADNMPGLPLKCGFKKFVIRGISLNRGDGFQRSDKFGLTQQQRGKVVQFVTFDLEFGAAQDFQIFVNDGVAYDQVNLPARQATIIFSSAPPK